MKNLDLHHMLFAFIEKLTSGSIVQSLSMACEGTMHWQNPIMVFHRHGQGHDICIFAFIKTRKDEKGLKQIQMKNKFKCANISFMHNHTLHDTLHHIYVFLQK